MRIESANTNAQYSALVTDRPDACQLLVDTYQHSVSIYRLPVLTHLKSVLTSIVLPPVSKVLTRFSPCTPLR